MQYLLLFAEGILTFISPCLLPMLPIYIFYFTGESGGTDRLRTLTNAVAFVLGFTAVFVLLGAFAGAAGRLLIRHQKEINVVTGAIVLLFGLNYMGILKIPLLHRSAGRELSFRNPGFFSTLLFGAVFSISWTPCVSALLGSALLMASQEGSVRQGIVMLFFYSAGLGVPFILSALLIDKLKSTFDRIKKHYALINKISGILLAGIGILMMSGHMRYLMAMFAF